MSKSGGRTSGTMTESYVGPASAGLKQDAKKAFSKLALSKADVAVMGPLDKAIGWGVLRGLSDRIADQNFFEVL